MMMLITFLNSRMMEAVLLDVLFNRLWHGCH